METNGRRISILVLIFCVLFGLASNGLAQEEESGISLPEPRIETWMGKFEIGLHYSFWSANLVKSWFEEELNSVIGEEIRDEVFRYLRDDFTLINADYEHDLAFNSEGHNIGLGLRFFPGGREGKFSLGVSLERNRMYGIVEGTVKQYFSDGSYAEVDSTMFIEFKPILLNFSFRWDVLPHFPVSPYFILGVGFGAVKGDFGYNYEGVYTWSGGQEEVDDSVAKTYQEWEEEIDTNLPNIFPLFHTGLGLRLQFVPFLSINAEASFWNGFIVRIGTALRF